MVQIYSPPFWKTWQFWAKVGLISFILLAIFLFKWVIFGNFMSVEQSTIFNVYFTLNDPEANFVFSLSNGMMLGAYMAILYSGNISSKTLKIIIFLTTIIMAILGVGIGFCFEVYLPTFVVQKFASNTEDGILFFTGNIALLSLIFFASLFAESESDTIEVDIKNE